MSTYPPSTSFVNILVFVKPNPAKPSGFDVSTSPAIPVITEADTVINYQIFDSAGYDIIFTGADVTPTDNAQLTSPSVSLSGKLLTISDANTKPLMLSVNLKFQIRGKSDSKFEHDPQISNNPPN
ncbi:hypothetical protein GTP45_13150 [Pseudoduganella sp. FT55W]|uniref:DP-EP family protein n=1 Tax=Duganella rivi TaxID=2666083 RepID=A0A7X4GRD3_9BURK|nr:hypothetical protein [Duganella rivi]MYM67775.1 hypothetical protein [Duganella rivi]